jgi:release factor glutamine methyltransferase
MVHQKEANVPYFLPNFAVPMNLDTLQKLLYKSIPSMQSLGERRAVARLLMEALTKGEFDAGMQDEDQQLSENEIRQLNSWINELVTGKPVQYVLGTSWFLDFQLKVGPDVLIPRPETEELVTLILSREAGDLRIMDLGTGSGCIAIGLKNMLKKASVYATDNSVRALEIARYNARKYSLSINFMEHDMQSGPALLPREMDILVSNPPYIAEGERSDLSTGVSSFEPTAALFAPEQDPLIFYKAISRIALGTLKPGGRVYLEINQQFGTETAALFQFPEFVSTQIIKDMSGNDRFIVTTRC